MNRVDRRWNLVAAKTTQGLKPPGPNALDIIEQMGIEDGLDYTIVMAAVGRVERAQFVHSQYEDHVEKLATKLREGYIPVGYVTYISPNPETLYVTALPQFAKDEAVLSTLDHCANHIAETFAASANQGPPNQEIPSDKYPSRAEVSQIRSRIAAERRAA